MKKRIYKGLGILLAAGLCLFGCAGTAETVETTSESAETTAAQAQSTESKEDDGLAKEAEWYPVTINGHEFMTNGYIVQEPECTIDITTSTFSDFGDTFTEEYPVTKDTYLLMEGTEYQMEVHHIASENDGPVIYVVAGVHGDERAGWFTGLLLRDATISSGELYVLAPANAKGSANLTRYVEDKQDMNRSFPGDPEGNAAEQVANAIYSDIAEKEPEFLFDLHEAIVYTEGRDCLGSTLIFTDLKGMEDMFFDMIFATEMGDLCSGPFGYNGPGPEGSINASVTRGLGIPTITVETFRGYDITQRVSDQLQIVEYVLEYKGMR